MPDRRVVPLVRDAGGGVAGALLDEELALSLSRGESYALSIQVELDVSYTMEVTYVGAEPRLLTGPEADTRRQLAPLPGEPTPGLVVGLLHPTAVATWLEVRAARGDTEVLRVVLRRWGSEGRRGASSGETGVLQDLEVFGNRRRARRLAPGEVWTLHSTVPENASRLVFDLAFDPTQPVNRPVPPGLALEVRLEAEDGQPLQLRCEVPDQRFKWETLSLDVAEFAGRSVSLSWSCTASPGTPPRAAGLAVAVPEWYCEQGRRRPNLILVSLDTTRPDHLGFHGYERDTSPALDALAARSVVFDLAHSTAPYTLPSHASLFSGQYPTTHGVEHRSQALDVERTPLLAATLRDAGYATRGFTGGGYLSAGFGFSHGFTRYSHLEPTVPRSGPDLKTLLETEWGRLFHAARQASSWDAARQWVDAHREVPFFLFMHTFAIHDYRPSGEHRGMFGSQLMDGEPVKPLRKLVGQIKKPYSADEQRQLVDLYDEAIHEVDAELGRLFASLGELEQSTIVVITSDHGEEMGDNPLRGSAVYGHGHGLWEALLRVPLVIHVPGAAARRVGQRVSSVDVAPTLLDLMGLEVPSSMQGRSLRTLFEGGALDQAELSPVVTELHSNRGQMRALYSQDLKLVESDPEARVTWPVLTPTQLFDLASDPLELNDLGQTRHATAEHMLQDLKLLVSEMRAQRSGEPSEAVLDDETRQRLIQLGYTDGG